MKALFCLSSILGAAALGAEGPSSPSTAPAQATVTHPVKEADLTTVTLTPQAVERLGIGTVAAERKVVSHQRLYGGEITLPLGLGADSEAIATLVPPQSPAELLKLAELQTAAAGELSQAQTRRDAARLALDRAEKLLASGTGSERAVEEARSAYLIAEATLEQAAASRALLGPDLATAHDSGRWWVRVAVLAADAGRLDSQAEASVSALGGGVPVAARRVPAAPRTANAAAATVDWYFEFEDPERLHRPGERVEVHLQVAGAGEERLVVPWASVLHDIHGGQWVYERTGETAFVRRRVQVARVADGRAVLASGPAAGAHIVTDGAAELFGIEFGPGK